jgi:hypothetical protein
MADGSGFTINDVPPPESTEEAIARLAQLPRLEYGLARKAEAKRLGIPVAILDKAVSDTRATDAPDEPNAGRAIILPEPEPWADPVDTAHLLDELTDALHRHMIMPPESETATALWIAHTWVFDRFDRTPRLAVTSPTKRCGKSTLLEILQSVSRRALRADSISASGVFRAVEALSPVSLLVDEADSFLPDNEELRGILNSGFARDGQVVRVVETRDGHVPVAFSTFAPVALAAIKAVPDTVADRSVPIRLARKAKNEKVTLLRAPGSRTALAEIARKLARWSADNRDNLSAEPSIPAAMGDREGDISVPLLSIADHASREWGENARKALLAVFGARARDHGDSEIGVLLLTDLKAIFPEDPDAKMGSKDLCDRLAKIEESPWAEWSKGKPITQHGLARLLRPFKVRPGTIRSGENTEKGYHRKSFDDAWKRYLPANEPPADTSGEHDPDQDDGWSEVL